VIDKEAVAMEEEAKRETSATVTVSDNEPKAGAPA
jgi:hypothetical protein